MADFTPAQIEQRRALKLAVRERRITPFEAEEQAIGLGLPSFLEGYENRHDITSNSTWWLPIAVLFYAWRDLVKTRREYERFETWGRDLWRDPRPDDSVLSLQEAEQLLRADLMTGVVRAFGTSLDHEAVSIPTREWRDLQFAGNQPLSACRADGSIVYSGVFVLRHEVVPLWLSETSAAVAAPIRRERAGSNQGGRVLADHWHDMWAEVCRIVHEEGPPTSRLEIVKRMQQWFVDRDLDAPSNQTLNPILSKLMQALKD